MGAIVGWLLATLVLTAAIHYAGIVLYPRLLVSVWLWKLARRGGMNRFLHGGPPRAEDRHIPRLASPDLAYSAAAFDLSGGPLRIRAPVADHYTSVSLYAANTDNFFVVNDRQAGGGRFDFVLIGPKSPEPSVPDVPVVRAPSSRGLILLRFLVVDREQLDRIELLRPEITCTAFEHS
jgi:uncharacterized membrane protein